MQPGIFGCQIAAAHQPFTHEGTAVWQHDLHHRPGIKPVELNLQPAARGTLVLQQRRRTADGVDGDVQVAIVVIIGDSTAPCQQRTNAVPVQPHLARPFAELPRLTFLLHIGIKAHQLCVAVKI